MALPRGGNTTNNNSRRYRNPQLPRTLNAPVQRHRYYCILAHMMEYLNNTTYPRDKVFTPQELNVLQPEDIYRWMCHKAFGREDPDQEDSPRMRSNTLDYYKKAISHFMPSIAQWNDATRTGNPTKSRLINNLINAVVKAQTRGNGARSRADRALTHHEMLQAIKLMGGGVTRRSSVQPKRYQAMIKFQYHMIGRCDDTAHVLKSSLNASMQFPGHLTAKMRWAKNVRDERDAPKQLMFGSKNSDYCVLLGLVLFLEKWIGDGDGAASQWLFCNGVTTSSSEIADKDKECIRCKDNYSKYLTDHVWENNAFMKDGPGQIGTHSVKKIATTTCRQQGASKDDCDYRARWKISRVQDRYTDVQLYWPDINAGMKLCEGGPCKYKVKNGLAISDDWLSANICPNITSSFDENVGAILAKSLVWAVFEPSMVSEVPSELITNVTRKIDDLKAAHNLELEEGENPIERVELLASLVGGHVRVDEVTRDPNDPHNHQVLGGAGMAASNEWRTRVLSKVDITAERVTEIQTHAVNKSAEVDRRLRTIEQIVKCISIAPARVVGGPGFTRQGERVRMGTVATGGNTERTGASTAPAVLSQCPRTLSQLWDEYQNGVEGNKPARDFTRVERGRVKYKYSKRKPYWECMVRLINGGTTVTEAISRIHRVYGHGTVTEILTKLRKDERRGGHARLRC